MAKTEKGHGSGVSESVYSGCET